MKALLSILLVGQMAPTLPSQLERDLRVVGENVRVHGLPAGGIYRSAVGASSASTSTDQMVVFLVSPSDLIEGFYESYYYSGMILPAVLMPGSQARVSSFFAWSDFFTLWWHQFFLNSNEEARGTAVLKKAVQPFTELSPELAARSVFVFQTADLEPALPDNWNYLAANLTRLALPSIAINSDQVFHEMRSTFGDRALFLEGSLAETIGPKIFQ